MSDANNPDAGTGIDAAASAIERIMAGDAGDQNTETRAEAASTSEDVEALADDEAEETQAAAEDTAEDDAAEEDAPDEEDAEEADEAGPLMLTVKIDGKTQQLPADEVVNGYQRSADYTRKTQALAEERKQFEQERASVQSERHYYAQVLANMEQVLAQNATQDPDWDRLYAEDPIEWVRQRELYRGRQEQIAAMRVEAERLREQQSAEQRQLLSQHIQEERGRLVEAIPTWKDEKVWDRDRQRLREYGRKAGFSDEELGQAYDHRAVVALYKAMRYDAMVAARKTVTPDPAKPAAQPRRASAAVSPRPVTELTRAKQRLAQTGRVADAAKVFESLM